MYAEAAQLLEHLAVERALPEPSLRAQAVRRPRGARGARRGTSADSAASSTLPSSSSLTGRPSRWRTVGAMSRSPAGAIGPAAMPAPDEDDQALRGARLPREPAGIAHEDQHAVGGHVRAQAAEQLVDEAVVAAHRVHARGQRRPRRAAARGVAELLHGDDVEAGEVDGLEVGHRRRTVEQARDRGARSRRCGARDPAERPRRPARAAARAGRRGGSRGPAGRPSRA